jgi:hypothetical protein
VAASLVTATGVPPDAAMVQISRCPSVFAQNAIRCPCGDHAGCTPSPSHSFVVAPDATSAIHKEDWVSRE